MKLRLKKTKRIVNFGKDRGQTRYYTTLDGNKTITLEEFCTECSRICRLSPIDLQMAIAAIARTLGDELSMGATVQAGDIGNFRLSISSKPMKDRSENARRAIQKIKILYHPGKKLREKCEEL